MRIKIFMNACENELQKEVNTWLEKNPELNISDVLQTDTIVNLTITILYT